MAYELGLFTRAYQELSFEMMLEKVKRHDDIRMLELTANYGSKHINIFDVDIDYMLQQVEISNLKLDSLSIHRDTHLLLGAKGKGTRHLYPGGQVEQQAYARKVLDKLPEVACQLGIKKIIGNIGCINFSDLFEWPDKSGWSKQLSIAKKEWMPILEKFSKYGVTFAHEIGPQQLAYDLESAVELNSYFENIDSFGFCIDPSQLLYLNVDPSICIESLGEKVYNFHAKDGEFNHTLGYSSSLPTSTTMKSKRGYRSRIPGWGDSDWKKIVTSLIIACYSGPLSIEIEDQFFTIEESLDKSLNFLNRVK